MWTQWILFLSDKKKFFFFFRSFKNGSSVNCNGAVFIVRSVLSGPHFCPFFSTSLLLRLLLLHLLFENQSIIKTHRQRHRKRKKKNPCFRFKLYFQETREREKKGSIFIGQRKQTNVFFLKLLDHYVGFI